MKQLTISDIKEIKKRETLIRTHQNSINTIREQIRRIMTI